MDPDKITEQLSVRGQSRSGLILRTKDWRGNAKKASFCRDTPHGVHRPIGVVPSATAKNPSFAT
jgi:hypothetical protein